MLQYDGQNKLYRLNSGGNGANVKFFNLYASNDPTKTKNAEGKMHLMNLKSEERPKYFHVFNNSMANLISICAERFASILKK